MGLLLLGAAAAEAQTVTLVSKLGKSVSGHTNLTLLDRAQPFTTGTNSSGYNLTSIRIKFRTRSGTLNIPSGSDAFTVRVVDGLTSTSTVVATLTNPATWSETSTLTAPAGTTLAASTTYYLIIEGSGGEPATSHGGGTDSGAAAGWSIPVKGKIRADAQSNVHSGWTDDSGNRATLFSVEGSVTVAAVVTTPPALVSATVVDGGDEIALVFDELVSINAALDLPASALSVTVDGSPTSFIEYDLPGGLLDFTQINLDGISPNITHGQTVIVSYMDPTAGDDITAVLQGVAGNDVASFTTGSGGVPAVINNLPPPPPDVTSVELVP